ncbi:MAG: DUF4157 domain-containing protein [Moorea sp. SIO3E2]|nr:DUF4157 domain-containing protein [Moorena sp. SIO4E2]NEQ12633.1 DUF4157 domain-containing protein [Moorena sp. SIO3E2]
MSANVMRTLESGQYQPETGWYEMGLQGKFSIGQPGERSRQGANHGGQMVVQQKRKMVQGRAQPLTGDTLTYGHGTWAERSVNENKTGLPDRLKAGIENLSGYSMDDVRVHYNSSKPAQLQAQAYAQGTEIHVGPGQEKHLPHEAWHVVQQKQGRVTPTMQVKGGVKVIEDAGLEKEANDMGMKAQFLFKKVMSVQSKAAQKSPYCAHVSPPIQMMGEKEQRPGKNEMDILYKGSLFFNGLSNIPEHNKLATVFAKNTAVLMGYSKLGKARDEYDKKGLLNYDTMKNTTYGLLYLTEGIGEALHLAPDLAKTYPNLMRIAPLAGALADFTQIPNYLKDKEDYPKAAMYGAYGSGNLLMLRQNPGIAKKLAFGIGTGFWIYNEVNEYYKKEKKEGTQIT